MLTNFKQKIIQTQEAKINTFIGGQGYPLLLLHGYPQNHYMWHKIAYRLAENFTVIVTDLRGYGDSSKPQGKADHSNYSKRAIAKDQVEVMSKLGYDKFHLVGHDRGARVAHRLTLDYPQQVTKLAVLDIIPTYELYTTSDQEFATAYYHWFFLIQPYPFPETLISSNPEYFLSHCLQSWSKTKDTFSTEAKAEYLRCFSDPKTIHGTCEDYRASADIDLVHDAENMDKKVTCPLLTLWGNKGIIGKKYDVIASWKKRAINVVGKGLDCGHFLPEEAPEATYKNLQKFLEL
ncbi:MAG: alpha/beta hydrolase [Xenococcaceae cyanobacterium MO_188.B19]|nr:alpha/beta hydrolase [Xenococcaceae cyanobacterium MO_188.B19]